MLKKKTSSRIRFRTINSDPDLVINLNLCKSGSVTLNRSWHKFVFTTNLVFPWASAVPTDPGHHGISLKLQHSLGTEQGQKDSVKRFALTSIFVLQIWTHCYAKWCKKSRMRTLPVVCTENCHLTLILTVYLGKWPWQVHRPIAKLV